MSKRPIEMLQTSFCRKETILHYEYFLQFFSTQYVVQIKDFEEDGMPEIFKKSSKT